MPAKPSTSLKKSAQIIKVNNSEIVVGESYELIHKKDLDAPQPIKGTGTKKLPMPGIKQIECVVFDDDARRWDTGFDIMSACNRSIPEVERASTVDSYIKVVKEPYEKYYNVNTDATNDDFWGGNDREEIKPYQFELYSGKSYNTNNPKDLFDLFHALKQGKICEVGEKDSTLQRSAVYCVKNQAKTTTLKEEKLLKKAEAFATLTNLVNTVDPEKDDTLYTVLEWINYTNIRGAEKEVIQRTVLAAFDNEKTGSDTIDRFLDAYEMTKKESTKQEMELFSILSKLQTKNKLIYRRQQYFLPDDTLLGNTTKAGAKAAVMNKELREKILDEWEKIQG